ncbi:serine hydrolase domain-containing protein [Nonomuraea sp. NPDC049480]|uniref:serine hydrolase domain-containing protein n=1 Tax=Nonomuraea sp. NPDC049480 TaxID=3364353 RepID=UPI0037AE9BE1
MSTGMMRLGGLLAAVSIAAALQTPVAAETDRPALREAMARYQTNDPQNQVAPADPAKKGKMYGFIARAMAGEQISTVQTGIAESPTPTGATRPRQAGEHFRIASITKTMTSIVVLQLVAEGKLRLSDSIEKWLPGAVKGCNIFYVHGSLCFDANKITIRDVLGHTSGLYSYTADPGFMAGIGLDIMGARKTTYAPADLLRTAVKHGPNFRPDLPPCADHPTDPKKKCSPAAKERFEYSNTNYVALSMIIKAVTGRTHSEEITTRIIQRLGLTGTSMPGADTTLPQPHAVHYSGQLMPGHPLGIWEATNLNPTMGPGTGDAISTTADLLTYLRAWTRGGLLPPAMMTEMRTLHPVWVEDQEDLAYRYGEQGEDVVYGVREVWARYGLGITQRTFTCPGGGDPVTVWGHNGAIPGSMSYAYVTEDGSRGLAVNLNGDWPGKPHPTETGKYEPNELVMLYDLLRAEFCAPA